MPGKNICIDESTIGFKGNCISLVYNSQKLDKWGMQFRVLCDCESKYVFAIKFYDKEKLTLCDTILYLTEKLVHRNHHLFVDNFYTSFSIVQTLLEKNIYLTDTLRRGRGGPLLMKAFKFKNLDKKSVIAFSKDNIDAYIFIDSSPVTFITSYCYHHNISQTGEFYYNGNEFTYNKHRETPSFLRRIIKIWGPWTHLIRN